MARVQNKKVIILLCLVLTLLFVACSSNNAIKDFSDTTWKSDDNFLILEFLEDELSINVNIKPDIGESDLEKGKNYNDIYDEGVYKNIKIEKDENNTLRIFNKDDLDLKFNIISKTEMEDEKGNIFTKR